jgi:acyl-[acyl-carrier-protein]-phospholipid O-acyltransferase / long-chain-fatty-acid--[acyl-carrier-protein] ligase
MKPFYLRAFLGFFRGVLYKITVRGAQNIPDQGGALLVSNHISFVDTLLILASTRRFVRFLLPEEVYHIWWLKPFFRLMRIIPLPEERKTRELAAACEQAAASLRNGELVGIFGERSISRIGVLLPFRHEFEKIMPGLDAPIIPVCLDGIWGSVFSYQAGRFFWKLPQRLRYPVSVNFGQKMPAQSSARDVRLAIQELSAAAWELRRPQMRPIGRSFLRCARRHPFRFAMADLRAPRTSFGGALIKSIFLARRLRKHWEGQAMVGVFMPASSGAILINLAALLAGKIPVNLNYTAGAATLASCARQCNLRHIITSREFLHRIKAELPCPALLIEEIAAAPKVAEQFMAFLLAAFAPARNLEQALGCETPPRLDDLATIVFSSGSTGEPKGVMLSHYNLVSNAHQMLQAFDFETSDRFLGILPLFHSFGFTSTLVVPALFGFGVVYHPNPLDAKAVGNLVHRYRLTYLLATPSFLQLYLRGCDPGDFGSLRLVMAGAEKLQETTAAAFEEKFGIRPLEGYGCTECSPVVAASRQDFRAAGFRQAGARRGTIGRPLPGMAVRLVDPETRQARFSDEPSLLLVRGPNIMQGYLNQPEKTAAVLQDGWYNTGDLAVMDEEGFIEIRGRLSRFIKTAGEMVPLDLIQEKLHELAATSDLTFAVAGVRDEKRGERLAVLHVMSEPAFSEFLKRLSQLPLPNLWIPKASQFYRIERMPLLGTGKLDLRRLNELAAQLSVEREPVGTVA